MPCLRSQVDELRRLKREQAETLLTLGVWHTADTLVCCRQDGEPLQPQSLTREFQRLRTRLADLPRVRLHDLRHSHATQLLAAGVHAKIVQERLGHSTITTTLDRYSHVMPSMQEDAAARIDEAFRHAGQQSGTGTSDPVVFPSVPSRPVVISSNISSKRGSGGFDGG